MRKAANFLIPITLITMYYAFWAVLMAFVVIRFPAVVDFLPIGGVGQLAESGAETFEPIYSSVEENVIAPEAAVKLAFASLGSAILIIPVSWVYFITSRDKNIDQSFVQTIIIMPIVVTGISMIVMNSIALAFSLAGIVAAVRFRFTLSQPSHAMYIFCAISIGLGSGIGAVAVSMVISMAFVYANMIIWKLEYGKTLSGVFFSMLTRRNRAEEDY
jgi:hypothetical protein